MPHDPIWFDVDRPTTNVCICERCREILRPAAGSGSSAVYRHCGQIWVLQGRYAKRLPGDFWDRFDYGDKAPKVYLNDDVATEPTVITNEPEAA